jgi:hypothetical protein
MKRKAKNHLDHTKKLLQKNQIISYEILEFLERTRTSLRLWTFVV